MAADAALRPLTGGPSLLPAAAVRAGLDTGETDPVVSKTRLVDAFMRGNLSTDALAVQMLRQLVGPGKIALGDPDAGERESKVFQSLTTGMTLQRLRRKAPLLRDIFWLQQQSGRQLGLVEWEAVLRPTLDNDAVIDLLGQLSGQQAQKTVQAALMSSRPLSASPQAWRHERPMTAR